MVALVMHFVIIPIDEAPFRVLRFTIVRSTSMCQASPVCIFDIRAWTGSSLRLTQLLSRVSVYSSKTSPTT